MLTSMVKRVDLAVYTAFGGVKPGVTALGLKEGAPDYAMDKVQRQAGDAGNAQGIEAAKADIISGKLQVVDSSRPRTAATDPAQPFSSFSTASAASLPLLTKCPAKKRRGSRARGSGCGVSTMPAPARRCRASRASARRRRPGATNSWR